MEEFKIDLHWREDHPRGGAAARLAAPEGSGATNCSAGVASAIQASTSATRLCGEAPLDRARHGRALTAVRPRLRYV